MSKLEGRTIAGLSGGGAAVVLAGFLITSFEGRVDHVYPDPVTRGAPWTYCDGETKHPRWNHVYTDLECDTETAREIVALDKAVMACVGHPLPDTGPKPLPDKVRATFDSLAWNIGQAAFCESTLARKAQAGNLIGACTEMLKWDHAGGKVIPGLTFRRNQEYAICLDGAEGS